MLKGKFIIGLAAMFAVAFSLACSFGGQIEEANKLVDEGNAIIKTNNEKSIKVSSLTADLFGNLPADAETVEDYKTTNKAKFDELVSLSEQVEKADTEITGKFDQASKLKLDDNFKKYLETKTAEFKKRGEANKLTAPMVKNFLQTKEADTMSKQLEDYNKKFTAAVKEADELGKKADQIAKDNPNTIK